MPVLDSPLAPVAFTPDSAAAWRRLALALLIGTVGGVGMWSVVVVLPIVQGEFAASRADASLAFTMTMLGFGVGGVATGRLADRLGILPAITIGIAALFCGYVGAGLSTALWQFTIIHVLIGLGASATFAPLMAEASHWFVKRRGIAVTIAASGNYLAGAIWPPLVERGTALYGWRATHVAIGIFCAIAMAILLLILRFSMRGTARQTQAAMRPSVNVGISTNALTVILSIAAFACCVAMAMPQVHIVAYCGDLGYGVARGAEMLALMLAFGIISRIGSGFIADRYGGMVTLLIGSIAQAIALILYIFFNGLTSLYVVSALFGLFQGGLVPSYALIVRETMPANEAATRVGIVIMVSVAGMAFGGWVSGLIFDATGSYRAAFLNGVGWNALNIGIALMLLFRSRRRPAFA
ncbi:MFS transporter [Bradyrhizobium sp. LHD-71]|uniref:MFS transporter n=1 Tax=Bradyrhizobium sp. LHD-71 TaxID=3072141 RepID=UPI00281056EA|nr:MFS transporter [Bradyrhizobium sp. LHD-71]MDQ8732427.1 MFS transporter [Bradyrhizobium sp. LHD-71]